MTIVCVFAWNGAPRPVSTTTHPSRELADRHAEQVRAYVKARGWAHVVHVAEVVS